MQSTKGCVPLFTEFFTVFDGLHYSILTVPIAKLFLSYNIRIDIQGILQPFMVKNF